VLPAAGAFHDLNAKAVSWHIVGAPTDGVRDWQLRRFSGSDQRGVPNGAPPS